MIAMARRFGFRVHSHVAEIDSEDELYRTGTGPWAQRVRDVASSRRTIAHRGGVGMGTTEFAASLGLFAQDCHLAHGIYLDAAGRAAMRRAGTIVALCPRSNLSLAQAPPPVAAYLEEAVPFAVGTDSLGSVASLDLMADIALLRRLAVANGYDRPDLDRRLIRAATLTGARALGLDAVLGSIDPGKRADLAVFSLDSDAAGAERALTERASGACSGVIVGGVPRSR
jgi:aminodeoxyfutalosine deaminase